jgi:hypothetical protein
MTNKRLFTPSFTLLFQLIFTTTISSFAQGNGYMFNDHTGRIVTESFVNEIERDIPNLISCSDSSMVFSYPQYLKDRFTLNKKISLAKEHEKLGFQDSLYNLYDEIVSLFPYQLPGYYHYSKFLLESNQTDRAIALLERGICEFGLSPNSFSYLHSLFKHNVAFSNRFEMLKSKYQECYRNDWIDSTIISVVDTAFYYDQLCRIISHPLYKLRADIDSSNANTYKKLVEEKGWLTKYVGTGKRTYIPILHFSLHHQLYFLNYIIADCSAGYAPWVDAEIILTKIVQKFQRINSSNYHILPFVTLDSISKRLDLAHSLIGIKPVVDKIIELWDNQHLTVIATSKHNGNNHIQDLEQIRKYFILLGYDRDKITVQEKFLDLKIEEEMNHITPFVIKRQRSY